MKASEIDDIICNIMITDGPDGHIDGHEVITDFIVALQNGKAEEWKILYYFNHKIETNESSKG